MLFERLMLFLFSFLVSIISALVIICLILIKIGYISAELIVDQIGILFTYPVTEPVVFIFFLVLFIISIRLMLSGIRRRERAPIIKSGVAGQIIISLNTFENIAISALKKIPEAKEFTAKVKKVNENVVVSINLSVMPDVNIPELSENIQNKIIEAIETTTGVKVLNVEVRINNIFTTGFKSKAE